MTPHKGKFYESLYESRRTSSVLSSEPSAVQLVCLLLYVHDVSGCVHRRSRRRRQIFLLLRRECSAPRLLSWGHHHRRTFPAPQTNQPENDSGSSLLQRVSTALADNDNQTIPFIQIPADGRSLLLSLLKRFDVEAFLQAQVMIYAIQEVNLGTPRLLPNFTLGYEIFDTCGDISFAIRSAMHMLDSHKTSECLMPKSLHAPLPEPRAKAVIGEKYSEVSIAVARLLALSSVTQVCLSSVL